MTRTHRFLRPRPPGAASALGWKHFIEGHLDRGALVPASGEYARFDSCDVATLTAKGRRKPMACEGLSFFERLA